ncbi:MAG: CAP domain-containing protein [Candidatus Aminicenantales bacterium]
MNPALAFFCAGVTLLGAQAQSTAPEAIEKDLLRRINNARLSRNLAPLKPLPRLDEMARRHSQDMAARGVLSHRSSNGRTTMDRLVEDGFYFEKIGENVASSDTFRSDIIHEELMDSPAHRANILDPDFERIGIGVVGVEGAKYFITQDFLRTVKKHPVPEAENRVKESLNRARTQEGFPPLRFLEEANLWARNFARKKALEEALPKVGERFGETHIHFITTPRLFLPADIQKKASSEIYEEAGAGVWFGRTRERPGGTYSIALFLFPTGQWDDLNEEELRAVVLEEINTEREAKGLIPLRLDERLSRAAATVSRRLKRQETEAPLSPESSPFQEVLSYVTENPGVWPSSVEESLLRVASGRVGIGVSFLAEKKRRKTYWITLILRRGP